MKRLLILFIAIVIILIAAALVQQRIHLQVHDVRDNFVTLQSLVSQQETIQYRALCDQIIHTWDAQRESWEVFIDHTTLDETERDIYCLQGYLDHNASTAMCIGLIKRIQAQLVQIDLQTRMTWGHLF
jgi:hypothetical protein